MRIRSAIAVLLMLFGLFALGASWVSFEVVRGYLDSLSGDGSADPYTNQLHQRVTTFAILVGIFGVFLAGCVLYIPRSFIDFKSRTLATKKSWKELLSGNVVWILGLTVIAAAIRIPFLNDSIRFDEAHSYLTYAEPPFFVGVSTYHDPNNHVFHTLLMHISTVILGNPEWAIRLPAFVAGVAVVPATFLAGYQLSSRTTGLTAAAIVAVSSVLIEYSVLGRGYTIVCLLTVLEIILAQQILQRLGGWEWLLLVIASSLGLWTVPIMAYANVLVWGWLLCHGLCEIQSELLRRFVVTWLVGVVATVALTVALYSPIILTSGFSALVANPYVESLSWKKFIRNIFDSVRESYWFLTRDWSIVSQVLLTACLLSAIASMRSKKIRRVIEFGVPLLILIALITFQRVLPPPRTWLFLIPIMSLFVGMGWEEIVHRRSVKRPVRRRSLWVLLCIAVSLPIVSMDDSISKSDAAGRCPDAEVIIVSLLDDPDQSPIVTISPVSSPVVYYADRHGMSPARFAYPTEETIFQTKVLVSHEQDQSVEFVLESAGVSSFGTVFRPSKTFETVTVYEAVVDP